MNTGDRGRVSGSGLAAAPGSGQIHRMQPKSLYDLLAPIYGRIVPGVFDRVTSRAAERLAAGGAASVLEVGVGPGHLLTRLGRSRATRVVGVDISRRMIELARTKMRTARRTEVSLVRGDALRLPFANGEFDGVVSVFLLGVLTDEQIPDALAEMARTLAPGGRIVLATLRFSSAVLHHGWMMAYSLVPDLVGRCRPVDLDSGAVETSGLRLVKEEQISELLGARVITLMKVRA